MGMRAVAISTLCVCTRRWGLTACGKARGALLAPTVRVGCCALLRQRRHRGGCAPSKFRCHALMSGDGISAHVARREGTCCCGGGGRRHCIMVMHAAALSTLRVCARRRGLTACGDARGALLAPTASGGCRAPLRRHRRCGGRAPSWLRCCGGDVRHRGFDTARLPCPKAEDTLLALPACRGDCTPWWHVAVPCCGALSSSLGTIACAHHTGHTAQTGAWCPLFTLLCAYGKTERGCGGTVIAAAIAHVHQRRRIMYTLCKRCAA